MTAFILEEMKMTLTETDNGSRSEDEGGSKRAIYRRTKNVTKESGLLSDRYV
jgi:hypothetical protein